MSETVTRNGWGNLWIESLQRIATSWHSRLQRGETYAQRGHVLSLTVTPGKLQARVQGSRSKPYTTTIEVPTFREHHWNDVIEELARSARAPAMLLAGRMPPEIFPYFDRRNLSLFPIRNSELYGTCNCPEKQRPCKHIAAVHFAFGEALQRDPFLLFQLRGADRATLLRGLRRAWFGADIVNPKDEPVDEAYEVGARVQPMSADRFNRSPEVLEEIPVFMRRSDQDYLILRRLGPPPSWSLPLLVEHLLGPVYDEAATLAMDVAHDETRSDELERADEDFGEELVDYSDDDEYDDGDTDGEGDDPTDVVDRRPLPSHAPPLPASTPIEIPATVASSTSAPPTAGVSFLLPQALGKSAAKARAAAEAAVTPEPAPAPERASVMLRKGTGASGPALRKRGGRAEAPPTPEPPVEAPSLPAIPRVPLTDSARSSGVASDPSRAREGVRSRKSRARSSPAPVVVRRNAGGELTLPPVESPPPAPEPSASPRRRRGASVAEPAPARATPPPAKATPAPDRATPAPPKPVPAPAPARRTREAAPGVSEAQGAEALDRGEIDAAATALRATFAARPSERGLLLLAAATDAQERRMECLNDVLERPPLRPKTSRTPPTLVELATRILASRYHEAAERAHAAVEPDAELVLVFCRMALEVARTEPPAPGTALADELDALFCWGEDWFPSMENPPAPLGAWVEWTRKDAPPSDRISRELLAAACELQRRAITAERIAPGDAARLASATAAVIRQRGDSDTAFRRSIYAIASETLRTQLVDHALAP